LRIEDPVFEQIFMHAEKNLDVRVKNDRKEWIGQDSHLMVTRNTMDKVSGDSHSEVVGKEVGKVGGDRRRNALLPGVNLADHLDYFSWIRGFKNVSPSSRFQRRWPTQGPSSSRLAVPCS